MSKFICTGLAQLGVLPVAVRIYFVRIYFAILLATSVLGQTVESPPAFEAASVKLNTGSAMYFNAGPGRIEMRSYTLKMLIFMAYGVRDYSLSGPDWLDSVKLDVVAKLPASAASRSPEDQRRMTGVMLEGLLAERFKLKVHREEKLIPGYALVVAPGGPKMRRVETPPRGAVTRGSITGTTTIGQIVASAEGALGRPVKDMTGLSGSYELNLTWTPEAALLAGADKSPDPGDRPPSIFTALQEQLGLRLEPRQFPLQIVVVDHVERVPTEN
jgi:uncharacterized protein (TIGR03435 family)